MNTTNSGPFGGPARTFTFLQPAFLGSLLDALLELELDTVAGGAVGLSRPLVLLLLEVSTSTSTTLCTERSMFARRSRHGVVLLCTRNKNADGFDSIFLTHTKFIPSFLLLVGT